jgi:Fe-S-cluster containining protein
MPSADRGAPWYAAGLEFTCTGCGGCCRGEGYVWMTPPEIEALAAFLGLSTADFGRRYLRRIGRSLSLIEKPNHDCIFWDDGCTVYAARPTQCRTFPFWPENLETPGAWEAVVHHCPGAGTGKHYDLVEIRRLSRGAGATVNGPEHGGDDDPCCSSPRGVR